jgi:hypothetical protein
MIHLANEKTLRIRHVASDVKREILTRAVWEQMIASHHSFNDDRGDVRTVTLPNEVFVAVQIPNGVRQSSDLSEIVAAQLRVLFELFD